MGDLNGSIGPLDDIISYVDENAAACKKGLDIFSDSREVAFPRNDWAGMIILSGKEICVGLVSGGEMGVIEELIPQLTLRVNLVEGAW